MKKFIKKEIKITKKYFKLFGVIILFIAMFSFLSGFESYTLALNQFSLAQHNSDLSFNMVNLKANLLEEGIEIISMYDNSNMGNISFEDLHYSSYIQLQQYKDLIENSFVKIIKSFLICLIGVCLIFYKN